MGDKTILKIEKQEETGLIMLKLIGVDKDSIYGWSLSEEVQKVLLDDLESHLRSFESDGYGESSQLVKQIIDEFSL